VDQTTGTNPIASPAPTSGEGQPAGAASTPGADGFRSRGSARRRARYLRKARELGYRDLGGLVFNLHRFGQRNDALVLAKLTGIGHIDTELRALEDVLHERQPVTVLREAGITACPRCAAMHSSEDGYCPSCGLAVGRNAELPIAATTPAASVDTEPPTATHAPSATPSPGGTPVSAATATPLPAPASPPPPPPPPAGASDETSASSAATAAGVASSPRVGRSPAPPSASGTRSGPIEEDGPTEILGPPVSGS
jgi:hypothetical protein